MKSAMWKIRSAKTLFYLFSPEDSSSAQKSIDVEFDESAWRLAKTLLWVVMSIMGALAIGHL